MKQVESLESDCKSRMASPFTQPFTHRDNMFKVHYMIRVSEVKSNLFPKFEFLHQSETIIV